jgi:hypothetical protein
MIRVPDNQSTYALADWVEASLFVLSEEPFRIADAEITGALQDFGLEAEAELANITKEIGRRSRLLGEVYPVERDGQGFVRAVNVLQQATYAFLLLASLNQHYSDLVYAEGVATVPARVFEQLTGLAIKGYIGGDFIRIGANRTAPVPFPFPEAVKFAAKQLKERSTYGQLENQASGDDGCDIIAWKPFADGSAGKLIILGQCAIGTGWKNKRSELDVGVWNEHINWHTKPIKAFAVPFVHEGGRTWRESCTRGGLVFDRLRIAQFARPEDITEPTHTELQGWIGERIGQVSGLTLNPV